MTEWATDLINTQRNSPLRAVLTVVGLCRTAGAEPGRRVRGSPGVVVRELDGRLGRAVRQTYECGPVPATLRVNAPECGLEAGIIDLKRRQ